MLYLHSKRFNCGYTHLENVFNVFAKFLVALLKKISVIGQSDVPDR